MPCRHIVVAICALAVCAPSVGAAAEGPVVAPGDKLAGRSHAQWLATSWKLVLAQPPLPKACDRALGVVVLGGGFSGKPETHTCSVPKGGRVVAPGFGANCSTIEDPPFHGDTPAELKSCARGLYKDGKAISQVLDGQTVARYPVASPVFTIHMPKKNLLGTKKRTGKAAAYNDMLLLRLSPGTHVLRMKATAGGHKFQVTYTLKVAG